MDPMLYYAVTEGKVEILLQFGGSQLEVQLTPTQNTALHVAAQSGHLGCVDEILNKCPRLLTSTNDKGETALHIAARKGSADIVKALIDCAKKSRSGGGAENTKEMLLRATNEDQDTALHMAVRMPRSYTFALRDQSKLLKKRGHLEVVQLQKRGYLEVIRMLTHEDSEFQHPPNNARETPLYIATERGFDEIVSDILEFSKNPAYTGPGRNALHAALLSECTVDTIKKLLKQKPELIKEQNDSGWTPIHCAALNSSPEIVKLLLEKDKSIAYIATAYMNGDRKTAFHIAATRGRLNVMKELLLHCPDCWEIVTDYKRRNILHFAMETLEIKVIKFILDNPLMEHLINQKDIEGNTPLHLFAAWRNAKAYECLGENHTWKLKLDGDWNAFNDGNLSPLDVEQLSGPPEWWPYQNLRNIVSNEKYYTTIWKKDLHDEQIDSTIDDLERRRFEGVRKVGESYS